MSSSVLLTKETSGINGGVNCKTWIGAIGNVNSDTINTKNTPSGVYSGVIDNTGGFGKCD